MSIVQTPAGTKKKNCKQKKKIVSKEKQKREEKGIRKKNLNWDEVRGEEKEEHP
jgi:hypothetical protein